MRILFINPPYTSLAGIRESAGHMMPLCFGYLAAYARKHLKNLTFRVLDAEAMGLGIDEVLERTSAFAPDVVGMTVPTPTVNYVYRIARGIRGNSPDARIVLGGIHPTVMPQRTIADCRAVDFVVVGEGEETFGELLGAIRNRDRDFSGIAGLWYRKGEEVFGTTRRPLLRALDDIPFPARDLFDLKLYRSAPTKRVSDEDPTPILTSRGCPYDCIHCPSKIIWERKVRYRSVKNVVDEMEACAVELNLREFNFFDDTFTLKRERVAEICREIMRRDLRVYWICFARTNTLEPEIVALMKSAGCRKISFGFESGSQAILDAMRKKTTIENATRSVKIARDAGIPVHGSFMFGNIGETEQTIRETIRFAKRLDLDNATFFITTPFPGTDLYTEAQRIGSITPVTRWESFAPLTNSEPIAVQTQVSARRLVYWQKRAFREFYLRPGYIKRKVPLLLSAGGARALFEGLRVLGRILRKKKSVPL